MDVEPLFADVEEHFCVTISPDLDYWQATVGDLYLYILGRVRRRERASCLTSPAFYHLRRTLTREFGIDRARVRPATRLCHLFPAATRGAVWPRLAAALGLAGLPELPRRRGPTARAFKLTLAGVSAGWWLLGPIVFLAAGEDFSVGDLLTIWLLLMLAVGEFFGLFWLAFAVDNLEKVRVPRVRHLVTRLTLQGAGESMARRVWQDLAGMVAAEAGVPVEEVHPEQRFCDLPDYC